MPGATAIIGTAQAGCLAWILRHGSLRGSPSWWAAPEVVVGGYGEWESEGFERVVRCCLYTTYSSMSGEYFSLTRVGSESPAPRPNNTCRRHTAVHDGSIQSARLGPCSTVMVMVMVMVMAIVIFSTFGKF